MMLRPFPPFESVLKSRDVEDPVNLWLHRPLAYAFAWAVYRTPMTPNLVTLLAMLVGIGSGVCWAIGTPPLMVVGGILLWSSAILDGADGILARAKQMFSDIGRALDGAADSVVVFASVAGGVYHLWRDHPDALSSAAVLGCVVSAVLHTHLYDFYKESYMHSTNPDFDGRFQTVDDLAAQVADLKRDGGPLAGIVATDMTRGLVRNQTVLVAALDPDGVRADMRFEGGERLAAIYREHNRRVVKAWSYISLAPHCYLFSICGMFDRLDLYIWIRVVPLNVMFVVIMLWQRTASRNTRRALDAAGLPPVPA